MIDLCHPPYPCLAIPQGTWTETRRVAELLAQLPQEVDVEAIVSRTLAASRVASKTGSSGSRSMGE